MLREPLPYLPRLPLQLAQPGIGGINSRFHLLAALVFFVVLLLILAELLSGSLQLGIQNFGLQ